MRRSHEEGRHLGSSFIRVEAWKAGVQRHLGRGSRLITFTLITFTLITTSTPITILLLLYYTATITTKYSLWCLTQPGRD